MCFSAAEYACLVRIYLNHAKEVDIVLKEKIYCNGLSQANKSRDNLYLQSDIALPNEKNKVAAYVEKTKQTQRSRNPMYGQSAATPRLKFEKGLLLRQAVQYYGWARVN